MTNLKQKIVTRCARRATRVAGHLGGEWKASAHRAYRRMVRMTDHRADDANYEPTGRTRITGWHVA